MCDLHEMIIYHIGKVICRKSIRFHQYLQHVKYISIIFINTQNVDLKKKNLWGARGPFNTYTFNINYHTPTSSIHTPLPDH